MSNPKPIVYTKYEEALARIIRNLEAENKKLREQVATELVYGPTRQDREPKRMAVGDLAKDADAYFEHFGGDERVAGSVEDQKAAEARCQRHECVNAAEPLHTCPYKREINDDNDSLCDCCDSHTRDCVDDI